MSASSHPYEVLLFYLYAELEDAEAVAAWQRKLMAELGLRGRILVASEGINGTLSGRVEDTAAYRRAVEEEGRFGELEWKIDPAEGHCFPRISVKVREEVVTLGLGEEDFSPRETTGRYLEPEQWREKMREKEVVLIDARNDYEWEMGHFEGALLPEVGSFRELPEWVREHREELEGKTILTYCTGGIRCEKFSGFLRREGFDEVYQLHGGIVKYGKDEVARGEGFLGDLYVFDERVGVPVNRTGEACKLQRCVECGGAQYAYRNCQWSACNAQITLCASCEEKRGCYCSKRCERGESRAQVAVTGE